MSAINTHRQGFVLVFVIILVIILASVGGYFAFVKESDPVAPRPTPASSTSSATREDVRTMAADPSEKSVYTNTKYGFRFIYPAGWRIGDHEFLQIFNYDESNTNRGFLKGQNKIEISLVDQHYLDPSSVFPEKESKTSFVQISGIQAKRKDTQSSDESVRRSYLIPLPNFPGRFLGMSVYGDPENFGVLDTIVQSIEWIK